MAAGGCAARHVLQGVDMQVAQLQEAIQDFGVLAELADIAVVPMGWDSPTMMRRQSTAGWLAMRPRATGGTEERGRAQPPRAALRRARARGCRLMK